MTITEHPLVKSYLAAVARETAGLSPERRNELLADLEEHIAVALAEEAASGDDEIRTVLARLGDPRTIAATALGDEPHAPQASLWRTLAILALLYMTGPLTLFTPLLGVPLLIGALWWLWTAPQWRNRDKMIGTAAALAPLLFWAAQFVVATGGLHFGLGALFIPATLAALALPAAIGLYLLLTARRPS
ncbi:HAAS signaling domain-containing protein [Streptomyces sp. NPDC015127]|uniref:HAAS signaling domain-containing protein n=1 Tax=Streptomyces sp. NPDC015127 TaxID=3364939 RepID=UPI0037016FA8